MLRRKPTIGRSLAVAAITAALVTAVASAAIAAPTHQYEAAEFPQEMVDWVNQCPRQEDAPPLLDASGNPVLDDAGNPRRMGMIACFRVKAYDGNLRIGKVNATIDEPIVTVLGAFIGSFDDPPVVVAARGGGDPKPVKISGGVLGIPQLDPLFDASLGLLSVSATPQLGELGAPGSGADQLAGGSIPHIVLPLSIKLNNTLFGPSCQIGTPAEPFVINLTTGTTAPPAGVAPISGSAGTRNPTLEWRNYGGAYQLGGTPDARNVDNAFAVPGASSCDLLPQAVRALGPQLGLGALFGPQRGLFDPLINHQVGLPAPAGRNEMAISVGLESALFDTVNLIHAGAKPVWVASESVPDFGSVDIGETASKTVTIENTGTAPLGVAAAWSLATVGGTDATDRSQFSLGQNGCQGKTLQPGEKCDVEVLFSPTSEGPKYVNLLNGGGFGKVRLTLKGNAGS